VTIHDLSATPAPAAPLDGCPRCVRRNNPAIDVRPDGDPDWPGITAVYRCAGCGHNWMTSWAVS